MGEWLVKLHFSTIRDTTMLLLAKKSSINKPQQFFKAQGAKCQMAGQNGELAHQKKFGWPYERENSKPKYSWVAKTNPDGTPRYFPTLCPESLTFNLAGLSQQLINMYVQGLSPFFKAKFQDFFRHFPGLWSFNPFSPKHENCCVAKFF